jgi:hypothetical protein
MIAEINPSWIKWGVKQIEGLEGDGKPTATRVDEEDGGEIATEVPGIPTV